MPGTRRHLVLQAEPAAVWDVVADPYHLPRWWPRVERVEGVEDGRWTSVLKTDKGATVRADFRVVEREEGSHLKWVQDVEGTPFQGLLKESVSEVRLTPDGDATRVTLEQRSSLRGMARFGGFMVGRAARRQLDDALASLAAIVG